MNGKLKWLVFPALLLPLVASALDTRTFRVDCDKARGDKAAYKQFKKSVFRNTITGAGEFTRNIDVPLREPQVVIEDPDGIVFEVFTMQEVADWMTIGKRYEFTGEINYIMDCDSVEIVNPDWAEVTEETE